LEHSHDFGTSAPAGAQAKSNRRTHLAQLGALMFAPLAHAQGAYPTKPVKLVVPFGAGGSADMLARLIAERLGTALKTTVVVENKPGATGAIGATHVTRSAPDGYTLLLVFDGTVGIAPVLQANFPFDPGQGPRSGGQAGRRRPGDCRESFGARAQHQAIAAVRRGQSGQAVVRVAGDG
jgi:hypothetical protein